MHWQRIRNAMLLNMCQTSQANFGFRCLCKRSNTHNSSSHRLLWHSIDHVFKNLSIIFMHTYTMRISAMYFCIFNDDNDTRLKYLCPKRYMHLLHETVQYFAIFNTARYIPARMHRYVLLWYLWKVTLFLPSRSSIYTVCCYRIFTLFTLIRKE